MRKGTAGFTILEVVFATGFVAVALGAIYLTHWRTLQVVREAHRSVDASQVLQEHAEDLRGLAWANLSNMSYVSGTNTTLGNTSLTTNEGQMTGATNLTESIVVTGTPTTTETYTVTRTINGATASVNSTGSSISSSATAVNVHMTIQWALGSSGTFSRDFEMTISNPPQ